MKSKLIKTIPYVDIEQLITGVISPDSFLNLLHEYGFVYFYNLDSYSLNLDSQQFKKIEACAHNFFAMPVEQKMQYYIGCSPNHRGYVPVTEKGAYGDEKSRIYEAFDMAYSLKGATKEDLEKLRGENIFPKEILGFKEVCENYYNKMFLLGKILLSIFSESFDLPKNYFEKYTKCPAAQLRLIHYLPNDSLVEKQDVAMGSHTDYECFTFLYQTSPGIQGYVDHEGQFVNLPVFKNTLLMVVGDMMHFMTNGYLKSFYHRVVNNGAERYSFPFFMNLDFETEIKILPKFRGFAPKKPTLVQELPDQITVGHHLMGQLYRDFPYIKAKIDQGKLKIPFTIPKNNLFESRK